MILLYEQKDVSVAVWEEVDAMADIYTTIDDVPFFKIEGLEDMRIDWDFFSNKRKKVRTGEGLVCWIRGSGENSDGEKVLYAAEPGIRVAMIKNTRLYRPVLLPPLDIIEEDGKKKGIVPANAISALASVVPRGRIVTKSRLKKTLKAVYSFYFPIAADADTNWDGYAYDRYGYKDCNYSCYGYVLNLHRIISDKGEIYGNGMCWPRKERTYLRRDHAALLRAEGVPTYEKDYRCFVEKPQDFEYDFSDLAVSVTKKNLDNDDEEDEEE